MDWRILALTVPTFFVVYQSLAKLIPKGTSIFLVNAYAALVGFAIMFLLHFATQTQKSVVLPAKALLLSLAIGLLIAGGNFGIVKAYSLGAPQSTFTPLFYISLIVYGILVGIIFWHEKIQLIQLLGLILAIAGIIIFFKFKK